MSKFPAAVSKRTASLDLILIVGVLLISKTVLLQIENLWAYAGPISLLATLGVATWRLNTSDQSWSDLGIKRPKSWLRLGIQTIIALVVTIAVGVIAQILVASLIDAPNEATQAIDARYQGRFDDLPGNLPKYLFWLAMAWGVGGFAEEMLFRGALFSRLESLFSGLPFAVILAILLQGVLFGQQHYYYQGLAGWISTGAIAVASGGLYMAFNRNLWPLILSHGLSNTIGLTLLYLSAPS